MSRSPYFHHALLVLAASFGGACASVSPSPFPQEAGSTRPSQLFTVSLGSRSMDDSTAWDQIDKPVSVGFEGGSVGDPIGYELGVFFARDSTTEMGVDVSANFLEASFGGRGTFGDGPLMPYVGAGISLILAEVEGESGGLTVSDDDAGAGLYIHGGALYRLGNTFYLGLDARLVTGTSVDIFGIDTDADYTQVALVLGWGF
jgi:opacity protein-like surface antigen